MKLTIEIPTNKYDSDNTFIFNVTDDDDDDNDSDDNSTDDDSDSETNSSVSTVDNNIVFNDGCPTCTVRRVTEKINDVMNIFDNECNNPMTDTEILRLIKTKIFSVYCILGSYNNITQSHN